MHENELRALIVDDSEMSRRITARIIAKVFRYDEAENVLIAVHKYQEAIEQGTPYDIVFMDIIMPEMDGKEAVRSIREYEASSGIMRVPIIMISASEMITEIEELVSGLLRKAVNKQTMDAMLQKLFDGKIAPL